MAFAQLSLLGRGSPAVDWEFRSVRRDDLGADAWIEYQAGWLEGHAELFDVLVTSTAWRADTRQMYERVVDVPRLTASLPEGGRGHPILSDISTALTRRYRRALGSVHLAYYRDGNDSVAPHGDRIGHEVDDALVAIVSVGEPRRFLLKPTGRGRSIRFDLGYGDLLVMGGTCQRTWQHSVPKVRCAGARISIQLRSSQGSPSGSREAIIGSSE